MSEGEALSERSLAQRSHSLPSAKFADGGAWRDHALCREKGNSLFFVQAERGTKMRVLDAQIELARQICAECPVRIQCLNYALRNDTRFGVWGGVYTNALEESERKALLAHLDKISA